MSGACLLIATVILQPEPIRHSCGEQAVFGCAQGLGVNCTIASVNERYRALRLGETCSIADLTIVLQGLGLESCIINVPSRDVRELPDCSIVHIDHAFGHFATYLGADDDGVILANAPLPLMRLSQSEFSKVWSGNAIAVFRTGAERDRFRDRLARRSLLRYVLVGVALIVGVVLCWPYHKRSIRWRSPIMLAAVCFCGCGDVNSNGATFVLTLPEAEREGVFVPPSGRNVKVIARNSGKAPVHILGVKASCACTDVDFPKIVLPGSDAILSVKIRGSASPSRRLLRLSVDTDQGVYPAEFTCETGKLPQVVPSVAELHVDDGAARGVIAVWFVGREGDRVVLRGHDARFRILNGDCEVRSPSHAILSRSGVCVVRVAVELDTIEEREGQTSLNALISTEPVAIPLRYRVVTTPLITAVPATMTFVTSGDVQERVFVVTGREPCMVSVSCDSQSLDAVVSAISDRSWKVACRPLRKVANGEVVEERIRIIVQIVRQEQEEELVIERRVIIRGGDL